MLQCHAPPPAHPFIIYIFKQHAPPSATTGRWNATSTRPENPLGGKNLYGLLLPAVNCDKAENAYLYTHPYSLLIKDNLSLCMGDGTSTLLQFSTPAFSPLRQPKNYVATQPACTPKDATTSYCNYGRLFYYSRQPR